MNVYGIDIPYKPLTNFELNDYAIKLNLDLRGVFMRDNLPKQPLKSECGIVNFYKSDESGSHWVCYFKKKVILKHILIVLDKLFYKKYMII